MKNMSKPKTSMAPQQPPQRTIAQTKVIRMSRLIKQSEKGIENKLNQLLNTGYRPLLINNHLIILVRAIQIPTPPPEGT